jgi:hypothetical protein
MGRFDPYTAASFPLVGGSEFFLENIIVVLKPRRTGQNT